MIEAVISAVVAIVLAVITMLVATIVNLKKELSIKQEKQYNEMKKGFDEVLNEMKQVTITQVEQHKDIIQILSDYKEIVKSVDEHDMELNDLRKDVMSIKINCAANNHKRKAG